MGEYQMPSGIRSTQYSKMPCLGRTETLKTETVIRSLERTEAALVKIGGSKSIVLSHLRWRHTAVITCVFTFYCAARRPCR